MAKENIKQIREAVCKNRGGHAGTSDQGIMTLWLALDEPTRKQYMDSIKKKGAANAADSKSE